VFVGLAEISGYFGRLALGLEREGYEVAFVDLGPDIYGFTGPSRSAASRVGRTLAQRRRLSRSRLARGAWRAPEVIFRAALMIWAFLRFDTFVFSFGQTFFLGHELWAFRAAGKRVISVFSGSDIRPPYMDGAVVRGLDVPDAEELVRQTRRRFEHAKRLEKHSSVVISHPLYSQFLSRAYVHFTAIGVPFEVPVDWQQSPRDGSTAVRVLHAPSDRVVKGTDLVRQAVEKVRRRGIAVEYREVAGLPHVEVLAALDWTDLVIDQAFSDIPWAGFACEAGARGKPTIVGGYGWDALQDVVPPDFIAPAVLTSPLGLADALARLATDAGELSRLGASARGFAERQLGVPAIQRFARVIDGDIAPSWWAQPRGTTYCLGGGVSLEAVAGAVGRMIDLAGVSSLQMDDNPATRARLMDLAATQRRAR